MIVLLLACTKDASQITVQTTIGADRDEDPDGVVGGATIDVYAASTESFSHAEADDDGAVTLVLPFGYSSFLVLHADGYAPTSYSLGPFYEESSLPDATLWLRSESSLAALEKEFGPSCPNIENAEGVALEGEIRLFLDGQELDTLPLVTTATATAFDSDGDSYLGCYLDDSGKPSAGAAETGATGRFAVFGAEAGTLVLQVQFELVEGIDSDPVTYPVIAEAGGAVPYYPAIVFAPI